MCRGGIHGTVSSCFSGGFRCSEITVSYRIARLSHIVRDVVSDAISNRVSDPRVSRLTSVTRVELSPDQRIANVHVSVMGTDAEATTTMKGLQSARGMIQTRLARRLDIRQCPILRFHLDMGLKAAIETIRRIDRAKTDSPACSAETEQTPSRDRPFSGAEDGPARREPEDSGVDR